MNNNLIIKFALAITILMGFSYLAFVTRQRIYELKYGWGRSEMMKIKALLEEDLKNEMKKTGINEEQLLKSYFECQNPKDKEDLAQKLCLKKDIKKRFYSMTALEWLYLPFYSESEYENLRDKINKEKSWIETFEENKKK